MESGVAALGTPDPGIDDGIIQCNTGTTGAVALTGSRKQCRSDIGALDMVGNVVEFVGDWGHASTCGTWASWSPSYGGDSSCMGADGVGAASVLPAPRCAVGGSSPAAPAAAPPPESSPSTRTALWPAWEEARGGRTSLPTRSQVVSAPLEPSCLAVQVNSSSDKVSGAITRLHHSSLWQSIDLGTGIR